MVGNYREQGDSVAVLDGPGFHVDVDEIDEAADGIHESVQDQDDFQLRDLCGDTELYGHTPLQSPRHSAASASPWPVPRRTHPDRPEQRSRQHATRAGVSARSRARVVFPASQQRQRHGLAETWRAQKFGFGANHGPRSRPTVPTMARTSRSGLMESPERIRTPISPSTPTEPTHFRKDGSHGARLSRGNR